jgi:hypothetical protein
LGTCRVASGIPINGHLVAMVLVGTKKGKRKHIQLNKPISLPTHFTDSRIDISANICRGHSPDRPPAHQWPALACIASRAPAVRYPRDCSAMSTIVMLPQCVRQWLSIPAAVTDCRIKL